MIDTAIYIGRFQPFHKGHYEVCIQALERAKKLIILIGSAGMGPLPNNPWSFDDRCKMIHQALPERLHARIQLLPLYDSLYDQAAWEIRVKKLVDAHASKNASKNATKGLVIFVKDDSSFYLDCFPEWQQIQMPMIVDQNNACISATDIRAHLYEHESIPKGILVSALETMITNNLKGKEFSKLVSAYETLKTKQSNQTTMYILVLISNGQAMLQQRQEPLGYQQWALPIWESRSEMNAFLEKNFAHATYKDTQSITSSMLKLPYEINYVTISQPVKLPHGYQLCSTQMMMQNSLFADHRSILYQPMSLNF